MSDQTFVVSWTDYVANDWVEVVVGPFESTDRALLDLERRGQHRFGMKHLCVSGSIGSERLALLTPEATPIDAFLALDWGLTTPVSEARAAVTAQTPCSTCGKPLADEVFDGLFDGVMSSAGDPFHHGCENF